MNDSRPALLVTTLAAASAIAASRIAALLCDMLFAWIATIPHEAVTLVLRWKPVWAFLLTTVAAFGLPYWQHIRLSRQSLKTNYIFAAILILLAACPISVRIKHHVQTVDDLEMTAVNADEVHKNTTE